MQVALLVRRREPVRVPHPNGAFSATLGWGFSFLGSSNDLSSESRCSSGRWSVVSDPFLAGCPVLNVAFFATLGRGFSLPVTRHPSPLPSR